MAGARGTLQDLAHELAAAFAVLKPAIASPDAFFGLMRELGWSAADVPPPILALSTAIDAVDDAVGRLFADEPGPADFESARVAVRDLHAAIGGLAGASFPAELAADGFAARFPAQLIHYIVVEHLRREHPRLATLLKALGILRVTFQPAEGNRPSYMRRELAWPDLGQLLDDPVIMLERVYGWRTPAFDGHALLADLQDFLLSVGVPAFLEEMPARQAQVLEEAGPLPGNPVRWRLNVPLYEHGSPTGEVATGLALLPLPGTAARLPGLALIPYATGEFAEDFPLDAHTRLRLRSGLDLRGGAGVIARPDEAVRIFTGFHDPDHASQARGMVTTRLEYANPGSERFHLLGARDGTRLEAKGGAGVGGLYLDSADRDDLYVELELRDGRLVIAPGGDDGFLNTVLPGDGVSIGFDLTAGLSSRRGFYFRGSSNLRIDLPAHASLGPVSVDGLTVAVIPAADQVTVEAGAAIAVQLGPLRAVVNGLGLRARLSFAGGAGNLGPIDLALGLKPPSGVGISVDGAGFSGGGFLDFDADRGRYSGALQLEFTGRIALSATGILTTRGPDGGSGYSLLIVISSQFDPIQLGLGFTLNGVGGLLGLHRGVDAAALRSAIGTDALAGVLFPDDPVGQIDRLLRDLERFFPQDPGRFVFGPSAKIGWGTPTLLTIDGALAIEVPAPVTIAIMGVFRAILPTEDLALLRLQAGFLGRIDVEQGALEFDAALFESRLLGFTLDGSASLRVMWGERKNFILTMGGFHPQFTPPPMGLPELKRLTIQLMSGNPDVRVEAYFAITSNTVQVGGGVFVNAHVSRFEIDGSLTIDVLIELSPFHFTAQLSATLDVRVAGVRIFGVGFTGILEGPTPWHVRGHASFKIWIFRYTKKFDETFGDDDDRRLPDVDVLPLLVEALGHRDNWRAELPARAHSLVTTAELPVAADEVLVHPYGTLVVSQKVVPLGIAIDRFGGGRPAGAREFSITRVEAGGLPVDANAAREEFAAGQFLDLGDETARVVHRAFEPLDAGKRIDGAAGRAATRVVPRPVTYEEIVIDRAGARVPFRRGGIAVPDFDRLLAGGAVSRSPLAANLALVPPDRGTTVRPETYVVVDADDLTPFDGGRAHGSRAEALDHMRKLIAAQPALAGRLQAVPAYELEAA